MIIYTAVIFGLGTAAGALVACVTASGSYASGYEDGYMNAWKIRDIVDGFDKRRG